MEFSLSTRWNAYRHRDGGALCDEILDVGFSQIELSYDITQDLVDGIRQRINDSSIRVGSVHNFCPVPVGAPFGHPELFLLGDPSTDTRKIAVRYTSQTLRFAAEVGARVVVVHAGRIPMRKRTRTLIDLAEDGQQHSPRFEKIKQAIIIKREKKAPKYLDALRTSLTELIPVMEETGVSMGLENLPSWETLPSESELLLLLQEFDTPLLGYWHDIGHGQIRENFGFVSQHAWLRRLKDRLLGMHIHDVEGPAGDHGLPPAGNVDFAAFQEFGSCDIVRVFEPTPGASGEELQTAHTVLKDAWETPDSER